jgi:hypothetical protein
MNPNSSVVGKQGTVFTVLGRYNDTDIIGGGMEIILLHCCFVRIKVYSVRIPVT